MGRARREENQLQGAFIRVKDILPGKGVEAWRVSWNELRTVGRKSKCGEQTEPLEQRPEARERVGNCRGPDVSLAGVRSGEAWADQEGDAADMYRCERLYSRKVSVPPLHSVNWGEICDRSEVRSVNERETVRLPPGEWQWAGQKLTRLSGD